MSRNALFSAMSGNWGCRRGQALVAGRCVAGRQGSPAVRWRHGGTGPAGRHQSAGGLSSPARRQASIVGWHSAPGLCAKPASAASHLRRWIPGQLCRKAGQPGPAARRTKRGLTDRPAWPARDAIHCRSRPLSPAVHRKYTQFLLPWRCLEDQEGLTASGDQASDLHLLGSGGGI